MPFNIPLSISSALANEVMASDQKLKILQQTFPANLLAPLAVAATVPQEPATDPIYKKAALTFGTLRQVEPIQDEYSRTAANIQELRNFASRAVNGKPSLLERIESFLRENANDFGSDDEFAKFLLSWDTGGVKKPFTFTAAIPQIGADTDFPTGYTPANNAKTFKHTSHSALFGAAKVATGDIALMEKLRHLLVKLRDIHQRKLADAQQQLAAQDKRIGDELVKLNLLDQKRRDTLDDYLVAQRLLAEHWQAIEKAYAERKRIIDNHRGLYFVRVRETPLSRTLPDPLDLRSAAVGDLVPGCANKPTTLPEGLQPFAETILDIPAADWTDLHELWAHLPGRQLLEQMVSKRRERVAAKLRQPIVSHVNPTLPALLRQQRAVVQKTVALPFPLGSLRETQQQGHRILSLEDMLASQLPALHEPANSLHQRLNAAAACLLTQLRAIAPSIRLHWAELADANTLAIENPERWPDVGKAEEADFNTLRTLFDLIAWYFRQLHADAASESRATVRNFVRACLLLAAGEDAQQRLEGRLQTPPARFHPGELLRLDLNLEPTLGKLLQLVDAQQRIIGTVRIEDHDSKGTLASITSVFDHTADLQQAVRVIGKK